MKGTLPKMKVYGCVLFGGLVLLAGVVQAEERTYVIGVEDLDYLPAYGISEDGEYQGFSRLVLDAFAAERGYVFEYRAYPVSRLYASFFGGEVDFKYPDNPTWNQNDRAPLENALSYSAPVVAYVDGVSVLPELAEAGVEDIAVLGTVAGFTPWAWMDHIAAGHVTLTENADFTALIRQVQGGRIDGAYANVAVVMDRLERVLGQPDALVFNPALPYSLGYYHLSSLHHPEVLADLDAWMDERADWIAALKQEMGVERGVEAVRP